MRRTALRDRRAGKKLLTANVAKRILKIRQAVLDKVLPSFTHSLPLQGFVRVNVIAGKPPARNSEEVFVRRKVYAFLLPMALLLCLPAWAADEPANVAGNWQLSWQGRQGSRQGTLAIQQNGTKLTGTMQGQRGSAPLTGTVKGNTVSLKVEIQGERRSFTLAFTGTVDGDKMTGTFQPQGGRGGRRGMGGGSENGQDNHTWTASRQQGNASPPDQPSSSN